MKDLAVIIPVYKVHKTIKRTLYSIAVQLNKRFKVYLSVDGEEKGSYDYLYDIFSDLDMEILYSPINRGAGGARQYAIDNTKEPFITFIDADDIFNSVSSLDILLGSIEERDVLVCTSFWRQVGEGSFRMKSASILTWMHGKIYRRSFLDKYNIRFNDKYTNSNEDVGFNTQCHLIANCIDERIKQLTDQTVYIQMQNEDSLTTRNNGEFKSTVSIEGYVMNKLYAHKHAIEDLGIFDKEIQESIVRSIVHIYMNYYGIYPNNKDYIERFNKFSKLFVNDLYKYVKDFPEDRTLELEKDLLEDEDNLIEFLKWKSSIIE